MPINVDSFIRAAQSHTITQTRDLVMTGTNAEDSVVLGRLGRFSCGTKSKTMNDNVRTAFRNALANEYGVFGSKAFDAVLGNAKAGTPLRVRDVRTIVDKSRLHFQDAVKNEILRQCETHPALEDYTPDERKLIGKHLETQIINEHPTAIQTLNQRVSDELNLIAQKLADRVLTINGVVSRDLITGIEYSSTPQIANNEPMGLSRWNATESPELVMRGNETSVEDRMRAGTLRAGMRINEGSSSPMLLEKLKTNGVEPGFIYKNDWSLTNTRGIMAFTDAQLINNFVDIAKNSPEDSQLKALHEVYQHALDQARLADQKVTEGIAAGINVDNANLTAAAYRESAEIALNGIMLSVGAHQSVSTAFAADYLIRAAASTPADQIPAEFSAFAKLREAVLSPQSGISLSPLSERGNFTADQKIALNNFKKANFALLRDAILQGPLPKDPMRQYPAFKHFADRHIMKLDYNEGDRWSSTPGSTGSLRLPKRVTKAFGFFRILRTTTAKEASVGAVAEVLANDLTRIAGVPAQDLTLVRGEFSDGAPKFMLEAKFADGYHDFDGYCLKDGRIQMPNNQKAENLGKYKAFFLLLADRDAVGSHGQNKGFINGRFFAIDPGHSLEGLGADLEIHDNFSFIDTKASRNFKTKHCTWFKNFSVFDDATRFEKFQGILNLHALKNSNRINDLFLSYKQSFTEDQATTDAERELYKSVSARIEDMKQQVDSQMDRLLEIFEPQLKAYHALPPDLGSSAIELIENFEKLTSPTTWVSENGKVQLQHLEVIEKSRIPWQISVDDDTGAVSYTSAKPLNAKARENLETFILNRRSDEVVYTVNDDGTASVRISQNKIPEMFTVFDEQRIADFTHNEEFIARQIQA